MSALSYWHDSLADGDDLVPRPSLPGDTDADVAIVGAGFTGLWTAYYLRRADPTIRVVVLEAETCGFGASGRNGGWCVGDQAGALPLLEREKGRDAVVAMLHEMHHTVDEVGEVVAREGIDCGYAKGGAIYLASNPSQVRRLRAWHDDVARYAPTYTLLSPREATGIVNASGIHSAMFTPHAAAVHPARLARGVADAAERLGAVIHERTPVTAIEPRTVRTSRGAVRADVVVRATEAYTGTLAGQEREVLPVGNYMIATEPIPEETWAEIGLANREVFEDTATLLGYGQRTTDGRIAWGGAGAPVWFNSRIPASPMTAPKIAEKLRALLVERFPVLRDIAVTHHWGGVLGMTRDLRPGVGLDRATGLAWAGGYGGSGVASANTAGRTLADLITGTESDLLRLPWVGHRSRPWEPEPARWLGVHAVTTRARVTDLRDRVLGRRST